MHNDKKSAIEARGAAAPVNKALLERLKTLEDRRATEVKPSAGKEVPKSARDDRKQRLLDEFREDVERQGRPRSAGSQKA